MVDWSCIYVGLSHFPIVRIYIVRIITCLVNKGSEFLHILSSIWQRQSPRKKFGTGRHNVIGGIQFLRQWRHNVIGSLQRTITMVFACIDE